jgi:TolA-binding protein
MLKRIVLIGNVLVLGYTVVFANEISVYDFDSQQQQHEEIREASPVTTEAEYVREPQTPTTLFGVQQKVLELEERVAGLTSVIEGLQTKIATLEGKGSSVAKGAFSEDAELLSKLAKMIDKINANYISREELERVLNETTPSRPSKHSEIVKKIPSIKEMSSKEVYRQASKAYIDRDYATATQYFKESEKRNYKPAASNFNLGEIAYYSQRYGDAIFYYKKSVGLSDKASYMDTLLLHTAIALDKTGKKSQAKAFYENVIENYPNKKSAEIAKRRVKKL